MTYLRTGVCHTGEGSLSNVLIGVENGRIASVRPAGDPFPADFGSIRDMPASPADFGSARDMPASPADFAGASPRPAGGVIDLSGLTVLPGFIDIHFHGGNGYDVMQGTYEAINGLSLHKLAEGVTSFCPATMTDTPENIRRALSGVRGALERGTDGARIIGAFIEGPYISREFRGAHTERLLRPDFTAREVEELIDFGAGAVASVALAPELPNALETIAALRRRGVNVRLGHTAATFAEAKAGIAAGGNVAIHTYNAMSPLNHREPGMVGAVMTEPGIYAELICDFIHVHPAAAAILLKMKGPDKVILVTDCISAGGLGDGEYNLGGEPVTVAGGVVRNSEGRLAGSTLSVITAVRNVCETLNAPLADAARMASANPAKALGIYDRTGSISEGKTADIIAIDGEYNVRFVMVGGEVKIMRG
ncbi:MAG: N-acetylglucosamine-6-phosphate deacetylase [Firmicutes bacterium]|nr:N-acetylglucosamine-6-phosphate deacetylase [Bacillota bacterium]